MPRPSHLLFVLKETIAVCIKGGKDSISMRKIIKNQLNIYVLKKKKKKEAFELERDRFGQAVYCYYCKFIIYDLIFKILGNLVFANSCY